MLRTKIDLQRQIEGATGTMDIFVPVRFKTFIQLSPAELSANFEERLKEKLRATHENVCTRFGYIRGGSIQILRRSAGQFVKQHFNGYIRFEMVCRALMCNPAMGSIVKGVVRNNKNAFAVYVESAVDGVPVLDIIIPKKTAGAKIQSDMSLDSLEAGQEVYVEVCGKRYQLNDTKISIIGRCVSEPTAKKDTPDGIDGDDNEGEEVAEAAEGAEGADGEGAEDGDSVIDMSGGEEEDEPEPDGVDAAAGADPDAEFFGGTKNGLVPQALKGVTLVDGEGDDDADDADDADGEDEADDDEDYDEDGAESDASSGGASDFGYE